MQKRKGSRSVYAPLWPAWCMNLYALALISVLSIFVYVYVYMDIYRYIQIQKTCVHFYYVSQLCAILYTHLFVCLFIYELFDCFVIC